MKSIYTMVGMKFRGAEPFVRSLKPGTAITLERERPTTLIHFAVKVSSATISSPT